MATVNRCAEEVNWCLQRGDTAVFGFDILNTDKTPATIAGFSYTLTVNSSPAPVGGTPPAEFSAVGAVSGNTVSINLTPSEADRVGVFFYDLQETDTGGLITTVAKGQIEWQQDITK